MSLTSFYLMCAKRQLRRKKLVVIIQLSVKYKFGHLLFALQFFMEAGFISLSGSSII